MVLTPVVLLRLVALVVVPLALLTACGGSSSKSLSKGDYVTKSEAICAKANKEIDALPQPKAITDLPALVDSTLSIAKKATAQLVALGDAQPDRARLHSIFLDPIDRQVKAFEAYEPEVKAAVVKGEAAVNALKDPTTGAVADTAAMKTYGFSSCVTTAETGDGK